MSHPKSPSSHPHFLGYKPQPCWTGCHHLILLVTELSNPASLVQRDHPGQASPWQPEAVGRPEARLPCMLCAPYASCGVPFRGRGRQGLHSSQEVGGRAPPIWTHSPLAHWLHSSPSPGLAHHPSCAPRSLHPEHVGRTPGLGRSGPHGGHLSPWPVLAEAAPD